MRCLIQRVQQASVSVAGAPVGSIESGLLAFLGIGHGDTVEVVQAMADKVAHVRVFADEAGRMNRSLLQSGGGCLVVSQFTLYADTRRGRRPSFGDAADPLVARPLCDSFCVALAGLGVAPVATGQFGAHMHVSLLNDGPVTLWLEHTP